MQQSSDVAETITHANGDAEDPRPAHSLRRHLDHVRVSSGRFAPEAAVRADMPSTEADYVSFSDPRNHRVARSQCVGPLKSSQILWR